MKTVQNKDRVRLPEQIWYLLWLLNITIENYEWGNLFAFKLLSM